MLPLFNAMIGCTVLAFGLSFFGQAAGAGECLRRPAYDRGLAILSPLESPDPCSSPVGGKYRYTPYYPGYKPDRRCLTIYGATSTNGYDGPGAFGNTPAPYGRSDYGAFTGANKDEKYLLHLGGMGPSLSVAPGQPQRATYDIIDRIQGMR